MLKLKAVPYFVLRYGELEDMIKDVYGHEYSFTAQEELGNDSCKTFLVEAGEDQDEWDLEDVKEFRETGKMYGGTRVLLDDMVRQELIPAGNYLIEVCW